MLSDGKGVDAQMVDILLRLLTYQHERVGTDYKVVFVGVMMRGGKRDGVELPVAVLYQGGMLNLATMTMIATAEQQQHAQQTTGNPCISLYFAHISFFFQRSEYTFI